MKRTAVALTLAVVLALLVLEGEAGATVIVQVDTLTINAEGTAAPLSTISGARPRFGYQGEYEHTDGFINFDVSGIQGDAAPFTLELTFEPNKARSGLSTVAVSWFENNESALDITDWYAAVTLVGNFQVDDGTPATFSLDVTSAIANATTPFVGFRLQITDSVLDTTDLNFSATDARIYTGTAVREVPEPGTFALALLAAGCLAVRRRWHGRS